MVAEDALKTIYDDVLRPSMNVYVHIRPAWINEKLYTHEVYKALQEDAYLAGGSFAFVFIYMWIYTTSFWLAFMGMTGMIVSFPVSYIFFRVALNIDEMMVLNFLALFLMLGIGADDVFVFTDTWSKSALVVPQQDTLLKDLGARLMWTWKKAGLAMLITSLTTAASFLSNLAGKIGVIREFGMFMGTCVIVNYIY